LKLSLSSACLGLPEPMSSELMASAAPYCVKAGDILFEAGDSGDGCHRLDRGVLKVVLASPRGEERILAILGSGAIVGDLAMIDGLPRSASVFALTDCELRFISSTDFHRCAERHPEMYRYLAAVLAKRLRETDDTISALAFLSAKGRVAYALLEIANSLGEETDSGGVFIPEMLSQKELAAMAGVARENANRILMEWQRKNLVSIESRSYRINDKAKLEKEMHWE
jgi:CRP/FNR family cyclic AMP-dependent transcriptional regulator